MASNGDRISLEVTDNDIKPGMDLFSHVARISDPVYHNKYEKDTYGEVKTVGGQAKAALILPPGDGHTGVALPRWMPSRLPPGKHRILLEAYFQNRSRIQQEYEIIWSGNWVVDEEAMQEELKIRKVGPSEYVLIKR